MSLTAAMFSGVSGLAAQSTAMATISDNISNTNTIGYKGTSALFSTLVTESATDTTYSAGGVQVHPRSQVDRQGLVTGSKTDNCWRRLLRCNGHTQPDGDRRKLCFHSRRYI